MALTIVVRSVDSDPPPQITFDAPRVVIGRGDGCEVRLPDPTVSHRHASVRQRGGDYIVVDEGSTNGTFVGPVRLSPQAPRILKHGDRIRVGRVWLEIRLEHAPVTANASATKELALALVARALDSAGEPSALRIRVVDGASSGRHLELTDFDRPYVVGRSPNADLALDDPDLSRRHVELVRRGERLLARDLGSKNGSRIEDDPLGDKARPWPEGRALCLGSHRLTYEDPVREALEELERAADEPVPAGEVASEPPRTDTDDAEPEGSPEETTVSKRRAPVAAPPKPVSEPPAPPPGWTATDILVALLAVVVLVLSIAGLAWLMSY